MLNSQAKIAALQMNTLGENISSVGPVLTIGPYEFGLDWCIANGALTRICSDVDHTVPIHSWYVF